MERLRPTVGRRPGAPASWLDVKLGVRMLVKHPGMTCVTVFALAIGIPVGLAPIHLTGALETPLPVDDGHRVQVLRFWDTTIRRPAATTMAEYREWQDELTTFASLAALRGSLFNVLSEDEISPPVPGAEVTASTFDVLRVPPALGRRLDRADEVVGAPAVVVIGHDLWRSRLGGTPDIVGREIRVGGELYTVVGVMPQGFRFPSHHQLWLPLRDPVAGERHQAAPLTIFGRLADGASVEAAQSEVSAVGLRTVTPGSGTPARLRPEVVPFYYVIFNGPIGGVRTLREFYLFQLVALVLLGVSCVNVGMLIFARTAARSSELAVRTALGASRSRIIAQVFTESAVLAVLAAGMGLLLLDWLPGRLLATALAVEEMPYWIDLGVTKATVLWALVLAVLSAAVAGVLPALRVTGRTVQRNIQRNVAARSGVRFGGLSGVLIVADVAMAVSVVALAFGLSDVLRTSWGNPEIAGVATDEYLTVRLRLPASGNALGGTTADPDDSTARVSGTQRAFVDRLRSEPAVRGVAMGTALPRMRHPRGFVEVDGDDRAGLPAYRVSTVRVDPGFFDALNAPILAGRGFDSNDQTPDASAVIVNTTFVDRVLGGRNAIGARIRYDLPGRDEPGPWYEIVGVVGKLGMHVLNPAEDQGVYHPLSFGAANPVHLAIHVGDDPEAFTPRLRALAVEVDPTAAITSPMPMSRIVQGDWYVMAATVLGGAALVAILLALATSGIYAIMSFAVSQRTREIGVRAALGASRRDIALTVARRALTQVGLGVLLGLPVAARVFFEVQEDGGASVGTATLGAFATAALLGLAVTVVVGTIACTWPTLRALRIMPTEALREGT